MTLDRIELAILAELQADAGIQNQVLADRVNLSPSACLKRVRRLKDEGEKIKEDSGRWNKSLATLRREHEEAKREALGRKSPKVTQKSPSKEKRVSPCGANPLI